MAAKINPIPAGYHTITPHLIVRNAKEAIDFYRRAFGAEELCSCMMPDGKALMHGELKIGDSRLFMCEENPKMGAKSPLSLGGSPISLHLYVQDVDKAFNRAVAAGAQVVMPVKDQFWGDRFGMVSDPYGHVWSLATHIEEVSPEEMQKRMAEAFKSGQCGG